MVNPEPIPETIATPTLWQNSPPHFGRFAILITSIASHIAFWYLLPNPLPKDTNSNLVAPVSTISVVTLPPQPAPKPQVANLADINQLNLTPPPILSIPPQTPAAPPVPSLPLANEEPRTNLRLSKLPPPSNLKFDVGESNLKPSVRNTLPPQDPVTGYSYRASDLIAPTWIGVLIDRYGAANIEQTQIAPAETPVPPDRREPIPWIPLDRSSLGNIKGTVVFIVVVNPNGQVTNAPLVIESSNSQLEEIARRTIEGYYNQFQPSANGKYRLVRIQYQVP